MINGLDDLNKLQKISKEKIESGEIIVMIGEKVIVDRDYDVLGALTTWKDHMYVLYPGVASTQHAVRVLTDKGHRAFLVGNQRFSETDEVQISSINGKVRVTNLSRTESLETVSLWDALLFGNEIGGGKAYRLSQLKTAGFQVPHGSVCTTVAFDKILNLVGENKVTLHKFGLINEKIDKNIDKVSTYLDKLFTDYRQTDAKFAVRSSATIEDGSQHSLAGMFDSCLNVSSPDLTKKIIVVIKSTFNKAVQNYLVHNPQLANVDLKMAVVIQQMVPAKAAGVIFGAKSQTKDTNIVEMEINNGLGESIVSGTATAVEYYSFDRSQRKVLEHKGPKYISESESRALFMLSERLRNMFSDVPQDIEWAIDQEGQIWVLQSRDMYIPS